jgi:hypothetical protein
MLIEVDESAQDRQAFRIADEMGLYWKKEWEVAQ